MPSWKKVILSGSDAALNSLTVTGGITGSLFGTASYATFAATASNSQNAQDILIYVKNVTGAQIDKGKVVRISGATGDNALIATASYESDGVSANTLGITTQNIPNDSFGYAITEGTLIGINTNAFSAGQLLYLGATGSIVGTAPQAPLHAVRLGQVLRVQINNGSMYVRIDNGYELGELHDVRDTSTTSSYGDLLVRSGSVWTNSRQLTGSYGLTGSLNATSFTGSLFGTASFATTASYATIAQNVLGSITNASTASFVTGSNVFGPLGSNSVISASQALTASYVANISPAITNNTNNYVLTATGGSTIQGEEKLTFDGTTLIATSRFQQGSTTSATSTSAHAQGANTLASGRGSHAEGQFTTGSGDYSHAEGDLSRALGIGSHAEGYNSEALGDYSHAEGESTYASGSYSHAEGYQAIASGSYSHAEGRDTISYGNYSHAEGRANYTYGDYSHAEGSSTQAIGDYSHAEGNVTIASGSYSHAEGESSIAIGDASHAEGITTTASGSYSHAEGESSIAIGYASHAEGNGTQAIGSYSHAEGGVNFTYGDFSHAEGYGTQALKNASHAEGYFTVASGSFQHVQGQYNLSSSAQSAFIIGNGVNDNARSNLVFASGSTFQVTGSVIATSGFTGSLLGTASFASTASFLNSTTNAFIQNGNSFGATALLGTNDNQSLALETSGSTRMFISSSGNVGIGTTTPSASLDVVGGNIVINYQSNYGSRNSINNIVPLIVVGTGSMSGVSQSNLYKAGYSNTNGFEIGTAAAVGIYGIDSDGTNVKTFGILTNNVRRLTIDSTGSLRVNGNTIITGSLAVSESLLQYSNITAVTSGSTSNVASFNTSSYTAAFFDYVTTSGTNARAGSVFTVWNGNSVEYTETSTNDIGNTNNLLLSASVTAGAVRLQATSLSGSWNVKTLARMI